MERGASKLTSYEFGRCWVGSDASVIDYGVGVVAMSRYVLVECDDMKCRGTIRSQVIGNGIMRLVSR